MGEIEFVKGGVYCFTVYVAGHVGNYYPTLYTGDRFVFFSDSSEVLESVVRDDLIKNRVKVAFVGMLEDFAARVQTTN
ncbi:hypothetical protein AVV29_gp026 [Vibrio phage phi 3]|uniref:Uncharacterized protein n=1 Tax=Vibrio phage phi 3 TaxID=1589298 RepID=A0A0B5HAM8_9CAUD|nr:hypothetical protein AVV29_gp026 [Vibrio phage phi 3]AJF40794.1 hypothetical protein SBVP3_0026 [Vibrio phage phi 3]